MPRSAITVLTAPKLELPEFDTENDSADMLFRLKDPVIKGERILKPERRAVVHQFSVNELSGRLTVGLYEDGTPAEVAIHLHHADHDTQQFIEVWMESVSLGLQHQIPLADIINQFSYPDATDSVYRLLDYITRWLANKFELPRVVTLDTLSKSD